MFCEAFERVDEMKHSESWPSFARLAMFTFFIRACSIRSVERIKSLLIVSNLPLLALYLTGINCHCVSWPEKMRMTHLRRVSKSIQFK